MSRAAHLGVVLFVATVLATAAGCSWGWDEVDYCGPDGVCVPCTRDDECRVTSSCCGKTHFCYHRQEDPFSTCSLGCSVPEPSSCVCDNGRCRFD